jgi:nucleoside-diphosphate-sugar epimerase
MKVALTGATGYIGSHVLTELREHGHEVTALVRDGTRADTVAAHGAKAAVVDLYDQPAVASVLADADGAIHTASPSDATTADLESAVVDGAIDAFAGTGKPYLEISGLWVYGDNTAITEESAFHAPTLVAWKEPIERRVLGARGMRAVVIVSGTAYGDGGGAIPRALLASPRDIRAPARPRPGPSSAGRRPIRRWPTSSAMAATVSETGGDRPPGQRLTVQAG